MTTFVEVAGGALALTHRPKLKRMGELGATHLVTLLTESEGARDVGAAAERAGLTWIWVPLQGAGIPDAERTDELRPRLEEIADAIRGGGRVAVHCSAGIHRTGMIGYALLRTLGLDRDDAREKLGKLRDVTAEGVGSDRLAWGDEVCPAPGR